MITAKSSHASTSAHCTGTGTFGYLGGETRKERITRRRRQLEKENAA